MNENRERSKTSKCLRQAQQTKALSRFGFALLLCGYWIKLISKQHQQDILTQGLHSVSNVALLLLERDAAGGFELDLGFSVCRVAHGHGRGHRWAVHVVEEDDVDARITPLEPPYEPAVGELLDGMMPPGVPPIGLFRTFARNEAMTAFRLWSEKPDKTLY